MLFVWYSILFIAGQLTPNAPKPPIEMMPNSTGTSDERCHDANRSWQQAFIARTSVLSCLLFDLHGCFWQPTLSQCDATTRAQKQGMELKALKRQLHAQQTRIKSEYYEKSKDADGIDLGANEPCKSWEPHSWGWHGRNGIFHGWHMHKADWGWGTDAALGHHISKLTLPIFI